MFYRVCGLRPGMIKFMLFLAFAFNVIGWSGIKAFYDSIPPLRQERKFSCEEEARRNKIYWSFCKNLVKVAEENEKYGKPYSPYDYFNDLKRIDLKKKEVAVDVLNINHEIDKLQRLSQKSLKQGYKDQDIEKAREDYKEFIDPGRESREELRAKFKKDCGKIPGWFWRLYLKTLPLMLILYLLWAKEEQGYYEKFLIPKPFRFSLLLVLYPLVIGRNIIRALRDNGREIYAHAELRRTKKLFAHISEEEQEKIKAFAKSNLSLSHWRQQIAGWGLKPQHSFALALAVTFIFVLLPRPAKAELKKDTTSPQKGVILEQISTKNLARMSIDEKNITQDKKISDWNGEHDGDCCFSSTLLTGLISATLLLFRKIIFLFEQFFRRIDHIPILAARPMLIHQSTQS